MNDKQYNQIVEKHTKYGNMPSEEDIEHAFGFGSDNCPELEKHIPWLVNKETGAMTQMILTCEERDKLNAMPHEERFQVTTIEYWAEIHASMTNADYACGEDYNKEDEKIWAFKRKVAKGILGAKRVNWKAVAEELKKLIT